MILDKLPKISYSPSRISPAPQREPWDERFWLDSLPSYTGTSATSSEKLKKPNKVNSSFRHRQNSYVHKAKTDQVKVTPEFRGLLMEELVKTWEEKGIPLHFQETFKFHLDLTTVSKSAKIIAQEIKNLNANRATIQQALQAIDLRERSLNQLHEMEGYLSTSDDPDQLNDIAVSCAEMLHSHRMLSLLAVEKIVEWRHSLADCFYGANIRNYEKVKRIPFYVDGENYLLKARSDNDFMRGSAYSKMFLISSFVDPFCLQSIKPVHHIPTTSFKSVRTRKNSVVTELPTLILHRIRMAEHVLLEEMLIRKRSATVSDISVAEVPSNISFDSSYAYRSNRSESVEPQDSVDLVPPSLAFEIRELKIKEACEEVVQEVIVDEVMEVCLSLALRDALRYSVKKQVEAEGASAGRQAGHIKQKSSLPVLSNRESPLRHSQRKQTQSPAVFSKSSVKLTPEKPEAFGSILTPKLKAIDLPPTMPKKSYPNDIIIWPLAAPEERKPIKTLSKPKVQKATKQTPSALQVNEAVSFQLADSLLFGVVEDELFIVVEETISNPSESHRVTPDRLESYSDKGDEIEDLPHVIRNEFASPSSKVIVSQGQVKHMEISKALLSIPPITSNPHWNTLTESSRTNATTNSKTATEVSSRMVLQDDIVDEAVYQSSIEQAASNLIEEAFGSSLDRVAEDVLKEIVELSSKELAASDLVQEDLLEEAAEAVLNEAVKLSSYTIPASDRLAADFVEEAVSSLIGQTVEAVFKEAIDLANIQQQAYCELEALVIDEACNELSKTCQEEAQVQAQKDQDEVEQTNSLALAIREQLFSEWLDASLLPALAEATISDLLTIDPVPSLQAPEHSLKPIFEKPIYVSPVFSPGIHSPNAYSAESSGFNSLRYADTLRSSMGESLSYDWPYEFAHDRLNFFDKDVRFVPVCASELAAGAILSSYYIRLPRELENVVISPDALIEQVLLGCESSLHWIVAREMIIGLVVVSFDPNHEELLNLLHFTTTEFKWYFSVFSRTLTWLWKHHPCDEVRVSLESTKKREDRPELKIKSRLGELGFTWKAVADHDEGIKMGLRRPNDAAKQATRRHGVSFAYTTILTSSRSEGGGEPLVDEALASAGNRINIVASLLAISEEAEPCREPYKRRMQTDLIEIFDIACATGKADYCELVVTQTETPGLVFETIANSEVNFRLLSTVSMVHSREGVSLSYLQVNSVKSRQCNVKTFYNSVKLYSLKTNFPHIAAFIITFPEVKAELKRTSSTSRFDLFARVEDLTQETAQEDKMTTLMFPCFNLTRTQSLRWLDGLAMQTLEEPWFVTGGTDKISAACEFGSVCVGNLLPRKSKCDIIEHEFVFGKV